MKPLVDDIGPYDIIPIARFTKQRVTNGERKLIKEVVMKMSAAIPKEVEEHLMLCDWLNKNGVYFIHIPNEGQRSVQQAVLLKRMGMKKGAPDFIIPGPENIAIELKRVKYTGTSGKQITPSKVSEAQKECLGELGQLGWTTYVAYGAADAIGFLQSREVVKKPLNKVVGKKVATATMKWGDRTVKVETPYVAKGKMKSVRYGVDVPGVGFVGVEDIE